MTSLGDLYPILFDHESSERTLGFLGLAFLTVLRKSCLVLTEVADKRTPCLFALFFFLVSLVNLV